MPGGRCGHNPARPQESNTKGAPEHFPAWRDAEHALTSAELRPRRHVRALAYSPS